MIGGCRKIGQIERGGCLQAKGISASPEQPLREIASANGTHAPALVEQLSAIR